MLIKVLSTFLVIQAISFAIWQGTRAWQVKTAVRIDESTEIHQTHEAAAIGVKTKPAIKPLPEVRFSARTEEQDYKPANPVKKKELIRIIHKLPAKHTGTLKNIILDLNPKAHRGLGGKSMIILRAVNIDPSEFISVFIHEIGHSVDLGHLDHAKKSQKSEFMDGQKPVYEGDLSLDFYRISWTDDKTRKRNASNLDFVSGYAMTDPFEDFAESYVYYVLHNKEFQSLASTNDRLRAKYQFIKNQVFGGKAFDSGELKSTKLLQRPWDITRLSYNLSDFLATNR